MAQKIKDFNALVMEKETMLHRDEGGYVAAHPRPLEYSIQVRCNVGLHAATKHYVSAWSASLLCARGSTAALLYASLLWFFLLSFSFLFLFQYRHVL